MRIISKFHDYYDSAMQYGIDPSLIYHRETSYITPEEDRNWFRKFVKNFENLYTTGYFGTTNLPHSYYEDINSGFLGFCGKVYLITFRGRVDQYSAIKALTNKEIEAKIEEYKNSPNRLREWKRAKIEKKNGEERINGKSISLELFHELKCPVFLCVPCPARWKEDQAIIIKNPNLKDLLFFQHVDPFTCYQELAMFVGGVLAEIDSAPQRVGSDEIIAQQKGFDKMSFRTLAPGQKKINRRENKARKRGITNEMD